VQGPKARGGHRAPDARGGVQGDGWRGRDMNSLLRLTFMSSWRRIKEITRYKVNFTLETVMTECCVNLVSFLLVDLLRQPR